MSHILHSKNIFLLIFKENKKKDKKKKYYLKFIHKIYVKKEIIY
jgi:hypothetical protein